MEDFEFGDRGCTLGASLVENWIVVEDHTLDFYQEMKLIYDMLRELCTKQKCMESESIGILLARIENQVTSQPYPTLEADANAALAGAKVDFPKCPDLYSKWQESVSQVYRGIVRAYYHMYQHHYDALNALNASQHVSAAYKRIFDFANEHRIMDLNELAQIQSNIVQFMNQ